MNAPAPISTASSWAGITLDRPRIMGILNVTPDSFSDGGRWIDAARAIEAGLTMTADGADIIDVGGESTRPNAVAVDAAEEVGRVMPVVHALVEQGVAVSVDTRHAATMHAVLGAGARIINDVSGLTHDPAAAEVVARHQAAVILMHMRGTPATMMAAAHYTNVVEDVLAELRQRLETAREAGIEVAKIALDPGIGFAKDLQHNLHILRRLGRFSTLGRPLVVGVSRKRFIGQIGQEAHVFQRMAGSLAAGLFAISQGVAILRVHDVRETMQAIRVWHALQH